jgi:hypothetical protein
MYVGNGGVNLISSFHVIGEIFDKVYPEGSIGEGSAILKNEFPESGLLILDEIHKYRRWRNLQKGFTIVLNFMINH